MLIKWQKEVPTVYQGMLHVLENCSAKEQPVAGNIDANYIITRCSKGFTVSYLTKNAMI